MLNILGFTGPIPRGPCVQLWFAISAFCLSGFVQNDSLLLNLIAALSGGNGKTNKHIYKQTYIHTERRYMDAVNTVIHSVTMPISGTDNRVELIESKVLLSFRVDHIFRMEIIRPDFCITGEPRSLSASGQRIQCNCKSWRVSSKWNTKNKYCCFRQFVLMHYI